MQTQLAMAIPLAISGWVLLPDQASTKGPTVQWYELTEAGNPAAN